MRKKFLQLDEYQFLDRLHLIIYYVRAHNFYYRRRKAH